MIKNSIANPIAYLRQMTKTRKPVRVRYAKMTWMGETNETDNYFVITLNSILDPKNIEQISNPLMFTYAQATFIDTLIHEWAHCVAGWEDDTNSHRLAWGKAYSQIYCEYLKFNDQLKIEE